MKTDQASLRRIVLVVGGGILFYWALEHYSLMIEWLGWVLHWLWPLLLGVFFAFLLNIPMRFFERHILRHPHHPRWAGARRPLCLALAILSVLVILGLVVGLVVPAFVNAIIQLAKTMPTLLDKLQVWMRENETRYPEIKQAEQWISAQNIDWDDTAKKLLSYVSGNAGNWLGSTVTVVSGIAGGVFSAIMGFLFSLYILLDKEQLKAQTKHLLQALLPEKASRRLFFVLHLSAHTFSGFVTGECLEAGMLGVLCWLGMLVLRLPYAAMVGALVGVTTLIPLIGGWIGTIVGALMIAVESIPQALVFIIFVSVLHGIADNYIYPKIVGSTVGLSPLWVLASVTVGGTMAGIAGMLFAVPVASVLYTLARLWTQRRLTPKDSPHTEGQPPTSPASSDDQSV